jgi:hypothetical protein
MIVNQKKKENSKIYSFEEIKREEGVYETITGSKHIRLIVLGTWDFRETVVLFFNQEELCLVPEEHGWEDHEFKKTDESVEFNIFKN